MELFTRFDYSKLDHSKDNTVNLVVSLTAPEIDWVTQRPKVCILPVLDVSGSMNGQKLDYAKASIRKLIEQLTPGDLAGFIVFSSTTQVVLSPAPVTSEYKLKLLSAIDKTECRGDTNLFEALQDSLKEIQNLDLPPSVLQRIIVFTDGEPTRGITDKTAIKEGFAEKRSNTTVSFFGYGGGSTLGMYGTCDQTFLTELSQLGKGNYAYVQSPDDSLSAFGKELGGLLSTYASRIKLVVTPLHGHKITKVVSDVVSEKDVTGELLIDLGDIFAEETRHVVLEVELQGQPQAFPRDTKVFDVTANFLRTLKDGKGPESIQAAAQVRFVRAKNVQTEPDVKVDEIVAIHQMVRSQMEAEVKAKQGEYLAAQQHMENTSQQLRSRGRVQVANVAQGVGLRLSDAQLYAGSQGYLVSLNQGTSRGMGTSALSADAARDLRACDVSLSNSVQSSYMNTFTNSVAPLTPGDSGSKS